MQLHRKQMSGEIAVDDNLDRLGLLHESIAPRSHTTYNSHQRRWAAWRAARGEPVYMVECETNAQYEEVLLQHLVYMGCRVGLAHSTCDGRFAAVTRMHILAGHQYDRSRMTLLNLAMRGLKRVQGGAKRKHAVTIDILYEMRERLDLEKLCDAVVWAATLMASNHSSLVTTVMMSLSSSR